MKKTFALFALIFLIFQSASLAHQPQLLGSEIMVVVREPEVSKAYYGELRGTPAAYFIRSDEPFHLYLNILVPDIRGISKEVSAKILCDGRVIAKLDASTSKWEPFFEEFGGDNYFKGPEYSEDVKPGDYEIVVYSGSNIGKYVLAIGDKEEFPPLDMFKALITMPFLKMYFGKSPLTAYFNRIGMFLLPPVLIMIAIVAAAVLIFKRHSKR